MFRQYRVHGVALPQARVTAAADRLTGTTIPRVQGVEKKLTDALAAHTAKDTSGVSDAMNDLKTQISNLQSDTNGLSAAALALTPSAFNADHTVTAGVEAKLTSARHAVTAAEKDIATVRAGLKG